MDYDSVVLSANPGNIQACITYAAEHGLGVEMMEFGYANALGDDMDARIARYQALLRPLHEAGLFLSMHGPFVDLASGSPDPLVNTLAMARYRTGLNVATRLGARLVVYHANFIALLRAPDYRQGWTERNIPFWRTLGLEARERGLQIAVENMWEFEPEIIADLLRAVDLPEVQACLDVGHAHLFTDAGVPFTRWVEVLAPYIAHIHMNNNDGKTDIHRPFGQGALNMAHILNLLRHLPHAPRTVLEMNTLADMQASLPYFQRSGRAQPEQGAAVSGTD